MTSYDEQKKQEQQEKQNEKIAKRAKWLPFKKYWLLYLGLVGTGALSIFAGVYLGLAPDEQGFFEISLENIAFALYYGVGFFITAEGAVLFWETKLVYHDVDKDGKTNKIQVNTAKVAMGISILAVALTGLAAADFIAVWRGQFSSFTSVQNWAQGWVVWAIPLLFLFHVCAAILYWYHSAEAALDRWKSQNQRQTQSLMAQIEADAWVEEYKRISPQLAQQKGRALAKRAAMEDFYAQEEKLGVDLDGDGRIGKPVRAQQNAPVTSFAADVKDYTPTVESKPANPS